MAPVIPRLLNSHRRRRVDGAIFISARSACSARESVFSAISARELGDPASPATLGTAV